METIKKILGPEHKLTPQTSPANESAQKSKTNSKSKTKSSKKPHFPIYTSLDINDNHVNILKELRNYI